MKRNYQTTIYACFIGYIVQAIVNNFVPLLFLTFQSSYGIPLTQITFLVTVNFGLQLLIDLLSVSFVNKIGYRASIIIAHLCSSLGLFLLAYLPDVCGNPFIGILISVMIYAMGGGLLEVLVSPIMESCPTPNKEKAMSLLHSFYCWGHVGVVLLSTVFFQIFGIQNWKILAIIWALIPLCNTYLFARTPIAPLIQNDEKEMSLKELALSKIFWLLLCMMICAGASEQAVSQWVSTFAEQELGVGKTIGDLAGPMLFAFLMGTSRAIYGKFGDKIPLEKFMTASVVLCIISYLLFALSPWPALGLLACGLCGFSVGIFWPGTFSTASAALPKGGTALFALLALGGDLGCSGGPTLVGLFSGITDNNLRFGILAAIVFPLFMLLCIRIISTTQKRQIHRP